MYQNIFIYLIVVFCLIGQSAFAEPNNSSNEQADTLLHLSSADSTSLEDIKTLIKDGQYAEAETQARQLLANVETEHGDESLEAAQVLDQLVESLWRGGKYNEEEAESLALRVVALKEALYGQRHPAVATSLNNLALIYWKRRQLEEAERIASRALAIREKTLGAIHEDVATSLNSLAVIVDELGKYDEVEQLYYRALSIREKVLEPNHPDIGKIHFNLGILYRILGRNVESESSFKRALAVFEESLAYDHPMTSSTVRSLVRIYSAQSRDDEAVALYEQRLAKLERIFGSEHTNVATELRRLAEYYSFHDKLTDAEPLYIRALAIRETVYDHGHVKIAESLFDLGWLNNQFGRIKAAESFMKRSLAIYEKAYGPDNLDVAYCLSGLGECFLAQGKFAEAESYFERAVKSAENALGPKDWEFASRLHDLGLVYVVQGRYAEAEKLYLRVLAIRKEILGSTPKLPQPGIAMALLNLSQAYSAQGKVAEAEAAIRQALEIFEAAGLTEGSWASALSVLASLIADQGKLGEAEILLKRVVDTYEEAYGPNHSITANGLANLGHLYRRQERYTEAEPLFQRALAIDRQVLSPNHQEIGDILDSYSEFHRAQKNSRKALKMAAQAVRIRRKNFEENVVVLSEKDAFNYSQFLRFSVNNYLSCLLELGLSDPNIAVSAAAEVIFSSKGQVSDGIFERRGRLVRLLSGAESLRLAKFQLSQLYVEGQGKNVARYRTKMDSLTRLTNRLEIKLARNNSSYGQFQDYKDVSAERIGWLLPRNSALVEYLKYDYQKLNPDTAIPHYMVVVIDGDIEPVIVDLGEAIEIEPLIEQYRTHLLNVSKSGRMPSAADLDEYRKISQSLYDKIWKPIEEQLTDKEQLFIAPDGGLNMLSFAGLIDDNDKYLVENFALHYLSSGRDLIRLRNRSDPATGLFAIGDPDYNATVEARLSEPEFPDDTLSEPVLYATTRNIRSGCGELNEMIVLPLPGTRSEVEQVSALWIEQSSEPATVYYGSQASEEKFKSEAPGNRVIHLATHGYFLEGACQPDISSRSSSSDAGFVGENPLLLSGLFFAGSNLHGEGSEVAGAEDGILTAYEVSEMVLDGTEMVVLSACETGLGKVQEGEGVYGLRRAFQMAGARTVVSALWPVSDKATASMMAELYNDTGETLPAKMRRIQLDRIAELRKVGLADHPFTWGAFIALGDWR